VLSEGSGTFGTSRAVRAPAGALAFLPMSWFQKNFEVSHASHKAILPMEGIRGLAVSLVFLVHYVTLAEPWLLRGSATADAARSIRSLGNIGVDLFFVLSGFLIYGMLIRSPRSFGPYLRRRVERIYPTFTVVFVLYVALSYLMPSTSKIPSGTSEALVYLVQNFLLLPGIFDIPAMITVAWSLSYELFYYLMVPAAIGALSLREWPPRVRATTYLVLSALLFWYFAVSGGPARLLMFIPGILMFEVMSNDWVRRMPPVGLPALLVALVSAPTLQAWGAPGWTTYPVLYVLFFLFCLECCLDRGPTARLFTWAPLRRLGNMSYSYYLIHGLGLKFLFLVLERVMPPTGESTVLFWLLLVPSFVFTLVPSAMLFLWVERPLSLSVPAAARR
jgi:exopolysaccharide production protein ExoZ